ncbi:MAG: AAA family ATPase [Bacteroidetes bacterium]|nr:AAA family ATPase [Bacteroidota bacterium]
MVKSVEVKNFKSISELNLDLGRINIFIGENGSGKSNILEAVGFCAAASANKLDKEFLSSRGIRVSEPRLMRNAQSVENLSEDIFVAVQISTNNNLSSTFRFPHSLSNSNEEFSQWKDDSKETTKQLTGFLLDYLFKNLSEEENELALSKVIATFSFDDNFVNKVRDLKAQMIKEGMYEPDKLKIITSSVAEAISKSSTESPKSGKSSYYHYKIFAPENTFLRKFEVEEAGDPLGIRGEGLFRLLRYFQNSEDQSYLNTIKETLFALDWFKDFKVQNSLYEGDRKLQILDRFIDTDISITQQSANEGFLFILFYVSLFISKDTPQFFAIDNLDASFNPKLCKHITQTLVKLAKDNDKQALFTTHNPFILDGLDLTDDEQRLFVVYRGKKGNTIAKRITPGKIDMPLSEQWMNGFLGGLPKNF